MPTKQRRTCGRAFKISQITLTNTGNMSNRQEGGRTGHFKNGLKSQVDMHLKVIVVGGRNFCFLRLVRAAEHILCTYFTYHVHTMCEYTSMYRRASTD